MVEKQDGIALIAAERKRQVEVEGFTYEGDAGYSDDQLSMAARCYALPPDMRRDPSGMLPEHSWPWDAHWWKSTPLDRVRELVKAGALIAAEIDRLQAAQEGSE